MRPLRWGIAPRLPVWRLLWRVLLCGRAAGLAGVFAVAGCTTSAVERLAPQAAGQTRLIATNASGRPNRANVCPAARPPWPNAADPFTLGSSERKRAACAPPLTSELDAEALIARAITEHEIRHP
jgi:hypothetical protein